MTHFTLQQAISTLVQVALTGTIGWLVHRLATVRAEFKQFMSEHEFLLNTAKNHSEAIIKLNKRLDRIARQRG